MSEFVNIGKIKKINKIDDYLSEKIRYIGKKGILDRNV
jgi:hypothetical protein